MWNTKPLVFVSLLFAGTAACAQTAAAAQAADVAPAASLTQAASSVRGHAGPSSAAHYSGPTQTHKTTIKQLLAQGHDDQYATISGKIVRHLGGHRYMLADATGELQVEIAPKHFPAGATVDEKTDVVVTGKFEKKHHGKPELEAKRVDLVAP